MQGVFGGQRSFDVGAYRFGRGGGRVALEDRTVAADQELREIPLDRLAAEYPRRFGGEPLPQRMRLGSIDPDLAHHRKAHAVVDLAERCDLVVASRILTAE